MRRRLLTCSTGWCVGPSSPTPMESCVNIPDKALLHERGQADGVSGIIGEHKERAAVGDEPAMQRKAVHDGTHDEFTHTIGQVVAVPVVAADAGSLFVPRAHGTGQVGGTAEQFRQMRSDGVQDVAVGDTCGDLRLVRVKTGDGGGGNAFPVGRQCAAIRRSNSAARSG